MMQLTASIFTAETRAEQTSANTRQQLAINQQQGKACA
jgi:hypothetical protein